MKWSRLHRLGIKSASCVVKGKLSGHVKVAAITEQPGVLSDC